MCHRYPVQDTDANIPQLVSVEIDHVNTWCQLHGLQLNMGKTKVMIPKKSTVPTPRFVNPKETTALKILGLTYTADLKWNTQVENVCKKASQRIFILKKLKHLVSRLDLIKLYNTMILSLLEYNAPVMVGLNTKNTEKIEKVRRRCHRIICGFECDCDALTPVSVRRLQQATKLFHSMTHPDNLLNHLIPQKLPQTGHYNIETMYTNRRLQAFIPHMSIHLNRRHL